MRKWVLVGDGGVGTGFSRVLRCIFTPLVQAGLLEVHHLAVNYGGDPHDYPWALYPAHIGGDTFGVNRLRGLVEAVGADTVFALGDVWTVASYMSVLRGHSARLIGYVTVDAEPLQTEWVQNLEGIGALFTPSEYGQRVLTNAIQRGGKRGRALAVPPVEVMPLGVDTARFAPFNGFPPDRTAARQALFGDLPEMHEMFVVLNANRNQPRKRIDMTLKGFAQFAQDKPQTVRLFLHMGMRDLGWYIPTLADRLGIGERLMLTSELDDMPTLPDEQLNLIYNACDVGLNTSSGEGWGLVSFEHAATGAAQVVPGHSAPLTLWDDAAVMLPPSVSLTERDLLTEQQIIVPETVAAALEKLYANPDYRSEMAKAAYTRATETRFNWSAIVQAWRSRLLD